MARKYLIDGVPMTAEQVGAIENPTDSQKKQFVQQSGMSDARLREIEAMVEAIVPPIRTYIVKAMTPLVDRIAALQQKVVDLQERPTISYEKTFSPDKLYSPGNLTTHQGSLWHANVETKGIAPGDGNVAWTLIVKRGRDGKDAR
jgi:hypothetical protein